MLGHSDVAEALVDSPQIALVSATGSSRMGRAVGPKVAARFGKRIDASTAIDKVDCHLRSHILGIFHHIFFGYPMVSRKNND